MTIIQEMRLNAKALRDMPAFADIYAHIASDMERWADWLENSGTLVPVPDGEACLNSSAKRWQRVLYGGDVWIASNIPYELERIHDNERIDPGPDAIVQPIKLLPIAEAMP